MCAVAPLLLASAAQGQDIKFADLRWGTRDAEVKSTLAAAGFTYIKTDEDGDLVFTGRALDHTARLYAFMTPDRSLVKVQVSVATDNDEVRSTYARMRNSLIEKYGTPTNDFHFFSQPYYEGDGYEETAISVGKGTFAVFWIRPGNGNLTLEISKALALNVEYESPAYHAEKVRRDQKAERIF